MDFGDWIRGLQTDCTRWPEPMPRIIRGVPQHEHQVHPGDRQLPEALRDQSGTETPALKPAGDRQRRENARRDILISRLDQRACEETIPDDRSIRFGDQGEPRRGRRVGEQVIDQLEDLSALRRSERAQVNSLDCRTIRVIGGSDHWITILHYLESRRCPVPVPSDLG